MLAATYSALLQSIVRYGWCALIVLGSMGGGDCRAADPAIDYLDASIEDISYRGDNRYRVDVVVRNRSNKTIAVKESSLSFSVQTEILGRWEELSAARDGDNAITPALPPLEAMHGFYILNIPLDIPSLYINSEGDINMMFKYRIRFAFAPGSGLRSQSGESSYWMTPKTNSWTLREGM